MNKIFIDVGSNVGLTIDYFSDKFGPFDKTYAFEPNHYHHHVYKELEEVQLIKKAVWEHDGEIDFYIDDSVKHLASSSVFKKVGRDDLEVKKVECVDFSAWLLNNLNKEDYNILKMDIEGAEFKVLNHALTHGGLELLDELYVEHHKNNLAGKPGQSIRDHAWGIGSLKRELKKLSHLRVLKIGKLIEESINE